MQHYRGSIKNKSQDYVLWKPEDRKYFNGRESDSERRGRDFERDLKLTCSSILYIQEFGITIYSFQT